MSTLVNDAAMLLCMISNNTKSNRTHHIINGLRRPTFLEVQKGLPAYFWVQDIVRPNGRKDKKYFSPSGTYFRSMKAASEYLNGV